MVSPANDYYGHRAILNRYAGRRDGAPIGGRVQHGWQLIKKAPDHRFPGLVPDLVWTEDDASARSRRSSVIGAPFAYLAQMEPVGPPQREGWLLAMPYHGHGVDLDGAHVTYAAYLRRRARAHETITVCLHPLEFGGAVRRIYAEQGFAVVTNGERHDPRFLLRYLDHLRRHDQVTSNRMSSGLLYAGLVERSIDLGGPLANQVDRSTVGIPYDEQVRIHEERFHALRSGVHGAAARRLAESELGAARILAPHQLHGVLGGSRATRAVTTALRTGNAVRKKVTRRRYGPLPESVGRGEAGRATAGGALRTFDAQDPTDGEAEPV